MKDECGDFEIGANVDPRKELSAILKGGGGLKLGYRLMKNELHEYVRILWVAEKACWDWYTRQVLDIKSPTDTLSYSMAMTDSKWASEPHLFATLSHTLFEFKYLEFMEIPIGKSTKARRALHLAWNIYAHRAWTLSKHSCPPECNAALLKSGPIAQAAADALKIQHKNILSLEIARHKVRAAADLWHTCLYISMQPVRLVWEYYKQDRYSCHSLRGRQMMMGLIQTMADNKAVEDVHNPIRLAAKKGSNDKMSASTVQHLVNESNVFEARGIQHRVKVDKAHKLFYLEVWRGVNHKQMRWYSHSI